MRVLVTGSRGMLGTDVMTLFQQTHDVFGLDLHNGNILDAAQVDAIVAQFRPDAIIHAAAYTNVDQAEADEAGAIALNETGTKHVALAAKAHGAKLVYISTDYVFDGTKRTPYLVSDEPHPLGVYGRSKWLGERQAQAILDPSRWLLVRTAWLYGLRGKNFVETILRLAQQQNPLRVVNDQTGAPTYTQDLARGLLALLEHHASGIVHLTNSGQCTWHEFARTILDAAGLAQVEIEPITTAELRRAAPRPGFSVLDLSTFAALTGQSVRHWKDGLLAYLKERNEHQL